MSDSLPRPLSLGEKLFAWLQYCLPTIALSRLVGRLAASRVHWWKTLLIFCFTRLFKLNMDEAAEPDPFAYENLNALFTRALRPGARSLPPAAEQLVSPVDGVMGQFGEIHRGQLFQAKGQAYAVEDLFPRQKSMAAAFLGGQFATFYLAPHHYHRIHMPIDGVLRETLYVPGRLFGVNPTSVRAIPRLFTRNERLTVLFDTQAGPIALVLIGAFSVGGMETVWLPGQRAATMRRHESFAPTGHARISLARGEEMGRFNLGSTVVLLSGPGALQWENGLAAGQNLRMGRSVARISRSS